MILDAAFFASPLDCNEIWDERTFTMANSAATKKPFKKTINNVRKISKTIEGGKSGEHDGVEMSVRLLDVVMYC